MELAQKLGVYAVYNSGPPCDSTALVLIDWLIDWKQYAQLSHSHHDHATRLINALRNDKQ